MKKIIATLAALMVVAATFPARAQLTITGENDGATKIATLNPMTSWIYQSNGQYILAIKSSNQFDPMFWLDLGPDKDAAIDTLSGLLDALKTARRGSQLEIESQGEKYLLTRETTFGAEIWVISAVDTRRVYAGYATLDDASMKKGLRVLRK